MDTLAKLHSHPRDRRVRFVDEGHVYYIDGDSRNIVSVTTLVKKYSIPFDADRVITGIFRSPAYKEGHKYWGLSREEIKENWAELGKDASTRGTAMHANIESVYNGIEVEDDSPEFDQFSRFKAEHDQLEPFRTEWVVFTDEHRIAGSIDMVFRDPDNGDLYIYDWKRSKEIKKRGFEKMRAPLNHLDDVNFNHYSLQLNIYKWILERYYDVKVRGLFLIVLHPDQKCYKKIPCADLQEEVTDLMEQRRLDLRG